MSRNSDRLIEYFNGCSFGKDYRNKFEALMRSGDFSMFEGAGDFSNAKNAKSVGEKMKFIFDLAREGGLDLYGNLDIEYESGEMDFLENLSSSLINQSDVATDLLDVFNKSLCKTTKNEGYYFQAAQGKPDWDRDVLVWNDKKAGLPAECDKNLLRDAVGVYAQMHETRSKRGFWFALFHPIVNAREKRIEKQMRDTLVNQYKLDPAALDKEISNPGKLYSPDPISAAIAAAKNPKAEIEAQKRDAMRSCVMNARAACLKENGYISNSYVLRKTNELYERAFPKAEKPEVEIYKKPQRKIRPDFMVEIEKEKDETLDIVNLPENEFLQKLKDVNDHTLYANFVGKNVEGSISKKERDEIEDKIKKEYPDATKEELKDKIDKVVEEVKSVYSMQNRMKDYGKQMNNEVEKQRNALIEMRNDPKGYKQRNEADIKDAKEEIGDTVFYLDITTSGNAMAMDKYNIDIATIEEVLKKDVANPSEKHKQALIDFHKANGNDFKPENPRELTVGEEMKLKADKDKFDKIEERHKRALNDFHKANKNQFDPTNPRELTAEEKMMLKADLDLKQEMRAVDKLERDMQRSAIVNDYKAKHADFFKTIDDKVQIDISADMEPKEKIDKI
ncbi:MAG: hypothetical protein KBS59_03335, partial [Clostridiales bacterium]|nr:hypothetical protein [Clostridiales bacterium]